jgi:hypothetical protein
LFVLTKDELFDSPSDAAMVMAGSPISGPATWITADGKNLKRVEKVETTANVETAAPSK